MSAEFKEFELDFVIYGLMAARGISYEEALPIALEEIREARD